MKQALKISVSGVRGVVGDSMTPQLAAEFAKAFGAFVGQGDVLVGRDTRPSGRMLEYAVVAGLQSVGCRPVLAGVVPTPSLLFLVQDRGARGGIMITASHNPAAWNALKFADRRGMFLDEIHAEEMFDIYHQHDYPFVHEPDIRSVIEIQSATAAHFDKVRRYVDADAIIARRFKVALDCCNGVGAIHSVQFLENLGCEVIPLFDAPMGDFERDPEPLPEHLGVLCEAVVKHGCAIGFAQDPDGDRLAVVNERGEPIGEDITVALAIQQVLEHHERGPVAINLSASNSVERAATDLGVEIVRTKTGEINVSETMLRVGAVAGGEHTGGIIIPAIHPCRDSYAGMAVILERLAKTGKSVSELRESIPHYVLIKDKMPLGNEVIPDVLRHIRRHFEGSNMNFLDGIYVDFGESWIHVRRSNTEPVLRIIAEAPSRPEAEELIRQLHGLVGTALKAKSG